MQKKKHRSLIYFIKQKHGKNTDDRRTMETIYKIEKIKYKNTEINKKKMEKESNQNQI